MPYVLAAVAVVLLLATARPGWALVVAVLASLLLPGRWWRWRTRRFRRGVKALRRGETARAREELERFLAEVEDDARFQRFQPWFNLGRRYPYIAAARSNLGIAALRRGEHETATAAFERALEAEPGFVQALYGLGVARWRRGRLVEAEGSALEALAANGSYVPARVLLAAIRRERGDRSGFEEVSAAIRERGHDPEELLRRFETEWDDADLGLDTELRSDAGGRHADAGDRRSTP